MSSGSNVLKGWMYSHYGSYQEMAENLGVSTSTVSSWAHEQPRNMLKFLPEIVGATGQTPDEVLRVVTDREAQIYGRK